MKKKMKRRLMICDGILIELVPNSEGTQRNSYIRIEQHGNYLTSIDRRPKIRKLRDWCNWMLGEEIVP